MRTFPTRDDALAYLQTEVPWGNAAGCCKSEREVRRYSEAGMKRVEYGSILPHQWDGNPGDNVAHDPASGASINSRGIPDAGIDAQLAHLPALRLLANRNGAQFWVNISASPKKPVDPNDYYMMARKLRESGACDGITANKSCGNLMFEGKRKPIICYDKLLYEDCVVALKQGAGDLPVAEKIAPITDPGVLETLVDIDVRRGVEWIVAANTFANCYLEDTGGHPLIPMVLGGLGGDWLRPVVRGMTKLIVPMLKGTSTKLQVVGGIKTGPHAYWCLANGAHSFGFNTVLTENDYDPMVIEQMMLGIPGVPGLGENIPGLLDLLVECGLPD